MLKTWEHMPCSKRIRKCGLPFTGEGMLSTSLVLSYWVHMRERKKKKTTHAKLGFSVEFYKKSKCWEVALGGAVMDGLWVFIPHLEELIKCAGKWHPFIYHMLLTPEYQVLWRYRSHFIYGSLTTLCVEYITEIMNPETLWIFLCTPCDMGSPGELR